MLHAGSWRCTAFFSNLTKQEAPWLDQSGVSMFWQMRLITSNYLLLSDFYFKVCGLIYRMSKLGQSYVNFAWPNRNQNMLTNGEANHWSNTFVRFWFWGLWVLGCDLECSILTNQEALQGSNAFSEKILPTNTSPTSFLIWSQTKTRILLKAHGARSTP